MTSNSLREGWGCSEEREGICSNPGFGLYGNTMRCQRRARAHTADLNSTTLCVLRFSMGVDSLSKAPSKNCRKLPLPLAHALASEEEPGGWSVETALWMPPRLKLCQSLPQQQARGFWRVRQVGSATKASHAVQYIGILGSIRIFSLCRFWFTKHLHTALLRNL